MTRFGTSGVVRLPALPVLGIAGIAFATIGLRQSIPTDWQLVSIAGAYAVALLGASAVTSWRRLPRQMLLFLPIACDGLVALLRAAQGGKDSGYATLAILPVVWVALAFGRDAVLLLTLCTFATLTTPIFVVGGAIYPLSGLRDAVVVTGVAGVVGLVVQQVVSEQHRDARLAEARSSTLDRLLQTQTAIATSEPGLSRVMEVVAAEALELTDADAAVVELPDGDASVYRAVAGSAEGFLGLRLPLVGSVSGLCMETKKTIVVSDSETDERVDKTFARRVGARSLVVVPLIHDGVAAGVVKVYSHQPNAVGWDEARSIGLLAHVITSALVSAELVETLSEHALTDKLTGLPNRRSWDEQLEQALARAGRSGEPVSIVLCDVNGLKRVNDAQGHAAGDVLLQTVARRFRDAARAGDTVARIGGDEFALLLRGIDLEGAHAIVARLQESLPPGSSVSAGIAQWDEVESGTALMVRADRRMYQEKRRTRVAV